MAKKYKITVTDDCIGCGSCEAIAPKLFKLNKQGKSVPLKNEITEKDYPEAKEAADSCPVSAIKIREQK